MPASNTLITVPICASTEGEFVAAISTAEAQADLIEFRLDCLAPSELGNVRKRLPELISSTRCPVILTYRSLEQGGHVAARESRLEFWKSLNYSESAFFDIEMELLPELLAYGTTLDWERVICSHHQFDGSMEGVEKLFDQMLETPARILKISVRVDDTIDCLSVFSFVEKARKQDRDVIAIAMGQAGIVTRVLAPSRGAFLTYAALGKGKETAAGQPTADELRSLYRIDQIDHETRVMGIIGKPVAQSFSPRIHNAAFKESGVNAVFIPFEVHDLPGFITRMANPRTRELDWPLRGLSVTAPHKRAVMDHLDVIDPDARQIGAVNTVVVDENGLSGYNTDVLGFVSSLKEVAGELSGMNAAVLGSGGAARAVLAGLVNEGATPVVFARDSEKGASLASAFDCSSRDLAGASFHQFDFVINATSLGMAGKFKEETPAIADQLRGARLVYDLVYNPSETRFLREAREAGCQTIGGLAMLVAQATAQFKLWTGLEAPEKVMRQAAEKALRDL